MHAEKAGGAKTLDVITIGRSSVDLYGDQIGGRLEDMGSFSKYIGGSPTNIACGAARLGLRAAVITGVGDEHMGRFIVEQLAREGVDTRGVKVDPDRLTALVILGIRDDTQFPLIFYRENCADMGLTVADIDEGFLAETRAVVATGTHLSHPRTAAAVLKALTLAREHGARTALDIDYRPNLWGVAGHGEGESRFVESAEVTRRLQATLQLFDLIVGTEEEFHIAGGSTDTLEALRAVRAVSDATLICKRGAKGAAAFAGAIPASLDDGETGPGFPIEVFNVLGAGDGFFAGLLKGWMEDADWPTALKYANACGAFAVSRHGCTPAYPSAEELAFFLDRGVLRPDLRNDQPLEQIHWSTNRAGAWPEMRVFAFDHRMQLEDMPGATPARIGEFKRLCLDAALQVADGRPGYGILCDDRLGRAALHAASGSGLWIGRPCEWPGSRPLAFEPALGADCGGLREWAREDVVKVLCFCHPDDAPELRAAQEASVRRLWEASRRNGLEFLLEIIPSKVGPVDDATTATLIRQFYEAGVWPDWWKLEPMTSRAAWARAIAAIEANDAHTRGIVVLGLDAPEAELAASFETAAGFDLVKGFAVGRTIFGEVARAWMKGETTDEAAVAEMARRYARLCALWDAARERAARRSRERGGTRMSRLLLRPFGTHGKVHEVTPASAGWRYVGFSLYRLRPGDVAAEATGAMEAILVMVEGKAAFRAAGRDWGVLGDRMNVFERTPPHSLYVPNGADWEARAETDCVIAVCLAPGKGGHPARRIGPEGITLAARGKGTNTRYVNNVAMENEDFCDSLLVTEVFTPAGHWSSYPSHRHDEDDFPRITYLEETYYHRLNPADGFGIQRVYTDDRSLDETMAVADGDVTLVPRGHHPCAAPYGFEMYYLNVMAGPLRKWRFVAAPEVERILRQDA